MVELCREKYKLQISHRKAYLFSGEAKLEISAKYHRRIKN